MVKESLLCQTGIMWKQMLVFRFLSLHNVLLLQGDLKELLCVVLSITIVKSTFSSPRPPIFSSLKKRQVKVMILFSRSSLD